MSSSIRASRGNKAVSEALKGIVSNSICIPYDVMFGEQVISLYPKS